LPAVRHQPVSTFRDRRFHSQPQDALRLMALFIEIICSLCCQNLQIFHFYFIRAFWDRRSEEQADIGVTFMAISLKFKY
jgi:hypothetical protein